MWVGVGGSALNSVVAPRVVHRRVKRKRGVMWVHPWGRVGGVAVGSKEFRMLTQIDTTRTQGTEGPLRKK